MCTFIDKSKDFFLILRKSVVPGAELNLRPHWHYYSGKEVPEPYQFKKNKEIKKKQICKCYGLLLLNLKKEKKSYKFIIEG